MSLQEIYNAASASPFQPSIGKDQQLVVGLVLLAIGSLFTVSFGLNRSLISLPLYALPASIAFGFGAVYTICGVEQPLFTALATSTKALSALLRSIAITKLATVVISPEGLRFQTEDSHAIQAATELSKSLFTSYNVQDSIDAAIPAFQVNIAALLETLQIFGITDSTNSTYKSQYGGLTSGYPAALSAQALGLGGTCRLTYSEVGAPLSIIIDESGVKTTCEMNTYDLPGMYEHDGSDMIPLDRGNLVLKIIMPGMWLYDAINELASTNTEEMVLSASSLHAPYFQLAGLSGPFGDSTVDFNPEYARVDDDSSVGGKRPAVTEAFTVAAPSGTHGRVRQKYRFDMIKKAVRAMNIASKVNIRMDKQGVLSFQFIVVPGDIHNEPGSFGSNEKLHFIDFRFVPLVDDEYDQNEEYGDTMSRGSSGM